MLLQFSLENYLSFKDEAVLSFIGNRTTKELENENITEWNDLKVLKSAVVYGANASGKSNLFSGVGYMKGIVLDSFKDAITEDFSTSKTKSRAFQLNSKTKDESSFFEVVFVQKNTQYRYGFEINKGEIDAEWLFYIPNKIETSLFYREGQKIEINGSKFKEGNKLETKTRENVLFLSVCAQFNGEISNSIIDWFKDINIISGVEDRSFGGYTTNKIKKDERFRKWVNRFIDFLEITKLSVEEENIANINIDEIDIPDEKKEIKDVLIAIHNLQKKQKTKSTLKSWHKVFDDNKILVDTVAFDFHMESKGTQKLIYLLGPIYDSLKNGKILFIDELDSRLHSILTKNLLKIFHEGNKNNAQFVFALHDPSSMENDCFRRDQIYLIEKDQYGASSLYSLLDYKKVRNDEKFSKNYLKGSYGAVPYINNFNNLMTEVYGEE
ncbi:MAG: ATP-binding protein [Saprospiraceae bacterium]